MPGRSNGVIDLSNLSSEASEEEVKVKKKKTSSTSSSSSSSSTRKKKKITDYTTQVKIVNNVIPADVPWGRLVALKGTSCLIFFIILFCGVPLLSTLTTLLSTLTPPPSTPPQIATQSYADGSTISEKTIANLLKLDATACPTCNF